MKLKDKEQKMLDSKDIRMQIILAYWRHKGIDPDNEDQYKAILKRELRASGDLKGYDLEKIKKCFKHLDGQKYLTKWTLETVFKFIDEFEKIEKPVDTREYLRRMYG